MSELLMMHVMKQSVEMLRPVKLQKLRQLLWLRK